MTQIIQYYKQNATLFNVTLIVLGVALIAIFLIAMLRKYVLKKRELKNEVEKATEALAVLPHTEAENDLFLDPKLNEETKTENEEAEMFSEAEKDENGEIQSEVVLSTDDKTNDEVNPDTSLKQEKLPDKKDVDDKKPVYKPEIEQSLLSKNSTEQNDLTKNRAEKPQIIEKPQIVSKTEKIDETARQTQQKSKPKYYPKRNQPTQKETKPTAKYSGKWLIYNDNGKYAANLVASNGEVLLRTESYTALSGIKSGIETVKNNIAKDNFAISVDKNGNYFFKLYSSSTRLLCVSEGYSTKAVLESAIESVKRFSKTAVVEIKTEETDLQKG